MVSGLQIVKCNCLREHARACLFMFWCIFLLLILTNDIVTIYLCTFLTLYQIHHINKLTNLTDVSQTKKNAEKDNIIYSEKQLKDIKMLLTK